MHVILLTQTTTGTPPALLEAYTRIKSLPYQPRYQAPDDGYGIQLTIVYNGEYASNTPPPRHVASPLKLDACLKAYQITINYDFRNSLLLLLRATRNILLFLQHVG